MRLVPIFLLGDRPLKGDAFSYLETAVCLLRGIPFEPWWPPGLPLYLIPFVRVFGDSPVVAMAAMIPWYVVASILLARVAEVLGGHRAAFFAARSWPFIRTTCSSLPTRRR